MVGVRGRYTIPKVLELRLPIDGYFPYPTTPPTPPRDAYVRIGSDGVVSDGRRPGDPVTITLLPDTLDVTAFSYLMIEEQQLHRLGDNPDFNFDGFSVGFGAGWEIRWSAGPIKLEASAKVLVGFGTNPFLLKGGIFVKGELSLVVVQGVRPRQHRRARSGTTAASRSTSRASSAARSRSSSSRSRAASGSRSATRSPRPLRRPRRRSARCR